MKFVNYLTGIQDVAVFPMVSMILFLTVFLLAGIHAFRTPKDIREKRARLPIE